MGKIEEAQKKFTQEFATRKGHRSSAGELPKGFERQREEKASTFAVSAQLFLLILQST